MKRFKRFFFSLAACFFILIFLPHAAEAKIYIDIDSPTFQQFPIAVCDFNVLTPDPAFANLGAEMADGIKKYLSFTGIFNILDKRSFLEKTQTGDPATLEKVHFPDWALIGADYLVMANLSCQNKRLEIDARFFDVTRGELHLSKKYSGKADKPKEMAKNIASDILFTLTGDPGDFDTKIAFIAKSKPFTNIQIIDYDGENRQELVNHHAIIMSPRWSPNGKYLAFTSFRDGAPHVFIRNLNTGGDKKVAAFEGLNLSGAFSPDGKTLLLTLSKEGIEEIYALEVESLRLRRLTHSYSIDVSPVWSPDGRYIAFVSNRSGSPQIYVMDADGNNVRRVTFEGNSTHPPPGRHAAIGLPMKEKSTASIRSSWLIPTGTT